MASEETQGFVFFWKIENFSFCPQKKGELLKSVVFEADIGKWYLAISPRGDSYDDFIGFYLYRGTDSAAQVEMSYDLTVFDVHGTANTRHFRTFWALRESGLGCPKFLSREKVFGKTGSDNFLKNDILTTCCRIWKINGTLPNPKQCFATTRIGINNRSFVWTIPNFLRDPKKKTMEVDSVSEVNIPLFVNILRSIGRGIFPIKVNIKTLPLRHKNQFTTCKISVLDANGKEVTAKKDEHWFGDSETWVFPEIIKSDISSNQTFTLLSKGALSLAFEMIISDGVEYNKLESTKCGICPSKSLGGVLKDLDCGLHYVAKAYSINSEEGLSMKEDFLKLFKNEKLCDSTLHTKNRVFRVHKAILCARSPVFDAMFTRNTPESKTGIVKITDLDEEAVHQMLLFMYTDNIGDLHWDKALKLYFASDKYDLRPLKNVCSSFLKDNLNPLRICQALVYADLHSDQSLISFLQDYIGRHDDEIISSDDWKNFMQSNAALAAKTLHSLYNKKRMKP